MVEFLQEEDFGASMREPLYGTTLGILECNVCIFKEGRRKCKKLGDIPDDMIECKRHDCPEAVLDTKRFNYPRYQEFYPEECKNSKKQE